MEAYAKHFKRGGNPDDIPKWARDDLQSMGIALDATGQTAPPQ